MRIRKRKVPFPISSLSPVPLSDPQFSEQLQLQSNPNENFTEKDDKVSHFASSDKPNHSIGESSKKDEKKDQKEREKKSNDDSRKGKFLGAKMASFLEEDKDSNVEENKFKKRTSNGENKKKMGVKNKKVGRGGAVLEGSRCSRVNGRGWRCCQPTLVGYSLCEHHLGKGRLRSMSSVRSQSITLSTTVEAEERKDILSDHDHEYEKKKSSLVSKKKQKLGMVKARSMSSLLGQVNNDAAEISKSIEE